MSVEGRLPQFITDRFTAIPSEVLDELPRGIALDLLLIQVQQGLKNSATPFSVSVRHFDLPLNEALAVVRLSDDGFSDSAAWWLAREASVSQAVDEIEDNSG